MRDLLDKLRRDVRKLKDVGPFCNDDGINALMDIHDELLRTVRKIEYAMRAEEDRKASAGVESQLKRSSGVSSAQ